MIAPEKIIAVTICATERYQYAMTAQARAVHANLCRLTNPIRIILVGDKKLENIEKLYRKLFERAKEQVRVVMIQNFTEQKAENYKPSAQLMIAQMRTAAFQAARTEGADFCWSLDSDVIPKTADCFRTLSWILEMPNAFYEVAISPYPSQGGGDMLTGRGTPEHPISQDYGNDERAIPEELQKRIDGNKAAIDALVKIAQEAKKPFPDLPKELRDEAGAIDKAIGECPPRGNVFEMNAKNGWRRRGWLSAAYPGLGRGSVVPTDWCGFGSTLLTRRALDECDFAGYDGGGTEDLYIIWKRWHQVGIRIGAALHEPSSHVSRRKDGKYFMSYVRFVTDADESKGECVGHLRTEQRPFYCHDAGELFDPANDGNPMAPQDRPKPVEVKPEIKPPEVLNADPAPAAAPVPAPEPAVIPVPEPEPAPEPAGAPAA